MNQETNAVNGPYTVYIHKFPDGKVYVGSSRQNPIEKRWRSGQGYRHQKFFYSAIKETGWDNIDHIIVKENLPEPEAQKLEQKLIKEYRSQNPEYGYNTKNGGQVFGEHSEDFLKNLHERMVDNTYCVGRKISEKHKEALKKGRMNAPKKPRKRHPVSDETRKIMSQKAKERWADPNYKEKWMASLRDMSGENNPRYGVKVSDETREKMRQKAIGRTASESTRKKMSEKRSIPVLQFDKNMSYIATHKSCKDGAIAVDGNSTNICFACRHENRTYKGFYWRYAKQKEEGASL